MSLLNLKLEHSVCSKKPNLIQRPEGKRANRVNSNPTLVGSYEILLSSVLIVIDIFMR